MAPKREKSRSYSLRSLLVTRGFCETDREAERWIMAGKVLVDGQRVDKAGTQIPATAELRITGRHRYASRGGYKLEAALDYFQLDVVDRVVVDCGASTGGFTDCLLQRGARLVYAVDAGFGQLVGRLQQHPRVRNLERTNLSDIVTLALDPPPTLMTLDLSYLSLATALPIASQVLNEGEVLALFKPLFEVESADARRTGKIETPMQLIPAFQRVFEAGKRSGLFPVDAAKLALQPKHGVHEFFVRFVCQPNVPSRNCEENDLLDLVGSDGIGNVEEDEPTRPDGPATSLSAREQAG